MAKNTLFSSETEKLVLGTVPLALGESLAFAYSVRKRSWKPYVLFEAVTIGAAWLFVRSYYKNTNYCCPDCGEIFKPSAGAFMRAPHTPHTRKLTCPACHHKTWMNEVRKK